MNPLTHLFFFDPKLEYGFLSNFYQLSQPLMYKGVAYPTSEHLYQALKFLGPNASETARAYAEVIRRQNTPNKAKILAKMQVASGVQATYKWRIDLDNLIKQAAADGVAPHSEWDNIKVERMRMVLMLKFGQNDDCRRLLLATGKAQLIEKNTHDSFWAGPRNELGKLLMQIRERLRAKEAQTLEKKRKEMSQ
jgi:ribA/ribD-fused uncharacterized protein